VKTIVKKGKYKAANNVTVELKEPIRLLISDEEEDQVRNVLHLSRNKDREFGIWHVFLNNESIYSTRVTLK
jgi:D-alanyl-D-alanine carboxypeptidase